MFKVGDKVVDGKGNIGIVLRTDGKYLYGHKHLPLEVRFGNDRLIYNFSSEGRFLTDKSIYDIRPLTPLEQLL